MSDVKNLMRIVVSSALNELIKSKGGECILSENVAVETPPNSQMGDLGSPMFAFAKSLKTSPQSIASEVLKIINEKQSLFFMRIVNYVLKLYFICYSSPFFSDSCISCNILLG